MTDFKRYRGLFGSSHNFWGVMSKKITPVIDFLGGEIIDVPGATSHDHGVRLRREGFLLEHEKKKSILSAASAKLATGMRKLTNSSNTPILKFNQ
tara:strand:+ start:39 stop:323 length:285 start_codon:yes stop_codon:yes gene_type:complete